MRKFTSAGSCSRVRRTCPGTRRQVPAPSQLPRSRVVLALLAQYAGKREVARECCAGCGRSEAQMKLCTACRVARFCGKECAVRMWPVHKPHCKRWKAEASAAAGNEA